MLNELALFAGAGGGLLASRLLGWRTVCAVEIDAYCRDVLMARQNDGALEPFPVWDDVRTFDGRAWRGRVDVISGGFPCQDISSAGTGAGIDGAKSGLWREFARIIREVEPRFVFVENSPMLTARGLGRVLGDLASLGFDAEWGVLGAHHIGAPHRRDRIWIVASHPDLTAIRVESWRICGTCRCGSSESVDDGVTRDAADAHGHGKHDGAVDAEVACASEPLADTDGAQREGYQRAKRGRTEYADARVAGWWAIEPDVGRVAYGVASRMDRLRAIGNGQVPGVAELAWRVLYRRLMESR